jgi:hypothetical protein
LPAIVLHVPRVVLEGSGNGERFYGPFQRGLRGRGIRCRMVLHDRATALDTIAADQAFHIFDHGGVRHPRALNTASAYLLPYRYMDPVGVRGFSSVGAAVFDAGAQDPARAAAFFAGLQQRFVDGRRSRYDQPEERLQVPAGCIAVFLQTESHRKVGETCHLSLRHMVKALLERDDPRPIVVKPHPRDTDLDTFGWLARKAQKDARLHILPANIHDILAQADVAVTINSAVGIEAMLHRVPVVLCGAADFHHICETVRGRDEMNDKIARAEARKAAGDWPFEAYLHWFYAEMCLDPTAPDFLDLFIGRVAAQGYNLMAAGNLSAR